MSTAGIIALSKRLESDLSVGLSEYRERQKFPYSYDDFYKAATNPNYDIFCCVENGKSYVPATRELFVYHNPSEYSKREARIIQNRMLIDTNNQRFDMQQIDNRRFMFNPKTGVLLLGVQYKPSKKIYGSHAEDLANARIYCGFDDYVRGWVGTEMFSQNGAEAQTVVRALGKRWEQPLFSVLTDLEQKASIHEQLKQKPEQQSTRQNQPTKKKEAEI